VSFTPGSPLLLAIDDNDNLVLSLNATANANGDYVVVGNVDFLASNGFLVPAGYYVQLFLSASTTASFAGQALRYTISYTPVSGGWAVGGVGQPIPICRGQLRFNRTPSQPEVYKL
jgi:hypothetical protein